MVFEGCSGLLRGNMSRKGPRVFEGTGLGLGGYCRGWRLVHPQSWVWVVCAGCKLYPPHQGFKMQAIGVGPDIWPEGGLDLPLGRLCELGQCVYRALCELSLDTGAQLLLRVTGGGVYMT